MDGTCRRVLVLSKGWPAEDVANLCGRSSSLEISSK
jgi:hypothetical protein